MSQMNLLEFTAVINRGFIVAELKEICFTMGIEHQNFDPDKSSFIRELVQYCQRHNRIDSLVNHITSANPSISFNGVSFQFEPPKEERAETFFGDTGHKDREKKAILELLSDGGMDGIRAALAYLVERS